MPGCVLALLCALAAQEKRPEVVSHVRVHSDKVDDVSSLEAWKRSFIKEGMTDEQKGLAVWKSTAMFQHQDFPPTEHLQDGDVADPIKIFNVYGYALCAQASCDVACLSRYIGLEARGWGINAHSVAEVKWDGAWHLLDASLINYFPKADGKIASVEEIQAAIKDWYDKNPGYRRDDAKLRKFHVEDGWQGWKKGPDLLARSPTLDARGWWPAKTHGWYSTMQEYDGSGGGNDGKAFLYEYGYSQGYQVNIQLRPGERLTRNWSHKGLHVNMKDGGAPGCLKMKAGADFMVYTPKFGDLAPGRVGNGVVEYDVPAAQLKGPFVLRMPSSYVYLSGQATFKAAGPVKVSFSDNHGLDWKEVAVTTPGNIDLTPFVFRRYDYRLKFDGKLDALRIVHDVQHSQRALPALAEGKNALTFSAGPSEGTITLEGAVKLDRKGKQLVYTDFHPKLEGISPELWIQGRGSITFPVSTPGDLARLRFGSHYRVRDPRDSLDYEVSVDGGKTWKTAARNPGPTGGHCSYVTFADIPPGTREALVRYAGTSRNTTGLLGFRIDADYLEPAGGFRPVKVTYAWEENGQPKKDVFIAKKPQAAWTITCGAKPLMTSIVLELAD